LVKQSIKGNSVCGSYDMIRLSLEEGASEQGKIMWLSFFSTCLGCVCVCHSVVAMTAVNE